MQLGPIITFSPIITFPFILTLTPIPLLSPISILCENFAPFSILIFAPHFSKIKFAQLALNFLDIFQLEE